MLLSAHEMLSRFSHIFMPLLAKQALYSSILALLIFPLTIILRKRALSWQIGLWSLVVLRLLLPPAVSGTWSARHMMENAYRAVFQVEKVESIPIFGTAAWFESQPSSQTLSASSLNAQPSLWEKILFGGWIAGLLVTAFRSMRQHARYRSVLQHADAVQDAALGRLLERYRAQFGIRRRIHLLTADVRLSPFTSGIMRPTIFLPSYLLQQHDDRTLEAVLAHEVVHIAQFDNLWLLVQQILHTAYFFHPLVWLMNRRLTVLRECRCDQVVIACCRIPALTYAKSLLKTIEYLVKPADTTLLSTFCSARPYRAMKLRLLRLSTLQQHATGGNLMSLSQKLRIVCFVLAFGVFVLPMAPEAERKAAHPGFVIPIHDGAISAHFGPMIHPITKQEKFHQGIDIAAPIGTEVYAVADGTVVSVVEEDDDYGKNLILRHADGFTSRYAKLNDILVMKGQEVKIGEKIALSGNTGISTGPHLHFELQQNGHHEDPADRIDFSALEPQS